MLAVRCQSFHNRNPYQHSSRLLTTYSLLRPSHETLELLMKSTKVTERIKAKALELLEQHPEGLRYSELHAKILIPVPDIRNWLGHI